MKYGVIFFEDTQEKGIVKAFVEFESQDQLKAWIRANHGDKNIRVIEFQDLDYSTELKVDIKRPSFVRSREGNMKT